MSNEFRITLMTHDGSLVGNRESDRELYYWPSEIPDTVFIEYTLKRECREKGVALISYEINDSGIDALVEYC